MPPKKDEPVKAKPKAQVPKELCGCGVNTYRAPPKGKKIPPPIVHNPGCSFQRATCNRYPNLPKCTSCEEGCAYCCGTNPWCIYCSENKCKFLFKRDVCGWKKDRPITTNAPDTGLTPPATAAKPK